MNVTHKIISPEVLNLNGVRLSYSSLYEPRPEHTLSDGKVVSPHYSVTVLIPKDAVQTIAAVEAASVEALKKKLSLTAEDALKKYQVLKLSPKQLALRPGELYPDKEEYEGMMFMNLKANLKYPPKLLHKYQGADGKPMELDRKIPAFQSVIYSGCYANVQVRLWAYNNQTVGINADVLVAQFAADGDAFGGGASADTSVFTAEPAPADDSGFGAAPNFGI